jgi:Family of unknown function (DUF5684)
VQNTFSPPANAPGPLFWIICLAVAAFEIATMWKLYQKAGYPGWASIVPIYNAIVLIQIARKPVWWILLYLIPIVNIVIAVIVTHNLSVNFGKGVGFTLGLLFLGPIFYPILAWGDAEYQSPAGTAVPA